MRLYETNGGSVDALPRRVPRRSGVWSARRERVNAPQATTAYGPIQGADSNVTSKAPLAHRDSGPFMARASARWLRTALFRRG